MVEDTPKSFVFWDNVHRIIKCKHIRVYEIDSRYHYDENDINYYFENDLLYEKFGLERIRYINILYDVRECMVIYCLKMQVLYL